MTDESRSGQEVIVAHSLADAEAVCAEHKVRMTRIRRDVLSVLRASECPVKAYDLIELLRERGIRLTPASMYRTLDFLIQFGLVHRIASMNAYVPCTCEHKNNAPLLFVCSQCRKVQEIDDPELYASMRSRFSELGMDLDDNSIEMRGTCRQCAEKC